MGSSFSLVELVAVLYQHFIRLNWADRNDDARDILALSKGHGVMALYACFREFGWLNDADIQGYFSPKNHLKGLSSAHVPGIEVSGGSLGHGITVSTGMALASKLKGSDRRVFALLGDGEMNEGSVWESLLFAAHHQLNRLFVIVDSNRFQAMGESSLILNMGSLKQKFEAFGFEVIEVDGHNVADLQNAFERLVTSTDPRPKALVAHTIKGKGVSFMENNNDWHYLRLTEETYQAALGELSP